MTAFKLKANPTFRAKVAIHVPGGESGEIEFEFRHKARDDLKAFLSKADKRKPEDVIMDIAVGWDADAEFGKDSVTLLTQQFHAAAGAIVDKYLDELMGRKLGN